MPSPFAGPGALPGGSPLDAPPPPPGPMGGDPAAGGVPTLSGLGSSMATPMTSGQLPPEILTGIVQATQKIKQMIDSFAQVTPDLAMDWDLCKTVIDKALGKVLAAGGGPASPQASGDQFPGGGFSAGLSQQGT